MRGGRKEGRRRRGEGGEKGRRVGREKKMETGGRERRKGDRKEGLLITKASFSYSYSVHTYVEITKGIYIICNM